MSQRSELVVVLLRSLDEWVPGVVTSTGRLVEVGGSRGEVRSVWVVCGRCGGRRTVGSPRRLREGVRSWAACGGCGGEGRRLVDPMTVDGRRSDAAVRRLRVTGEAEDVRLDRQRRERELRRLEVLAAHRRGVVDAREEEGWERARRVLDRSGSFRDLRRLLVELGAEDRAVLVAVYGPDSSLRRVGAGLQQRADRVVEWLAERMPEEIRVPSWALEPAGGKDELWRRRVPAAAKRRRDRDSEVRRLRDAGLTVRELAARFSLSEQHVRRIVAVSKEGDGACAV